MSPLPTLPDSAARRLAPPAGNAAPRPAAKAADDSPKDALIQALTEQLEQAAEQLDRLQRTGADRKRGALAGGLPADLVEEHRQTVADLQRVVQQWEDMQASVTLGRIEMQLTELREFVGQRLEVASGLPIERHAGLKVHEEPAQFSHASATTDDAKSPADSEWERLKSQLLNSSETSHATTSGEASSEPLPEPPPAADLSAASREELLAAIQMRDDFIAAMMRRLRHQEVVQPMSELLAHGTESPACLQRVTELERQLQEHLRIAEVELAHERAKIARDHSRLQQQQEQIDKQLKKLGLQSADDADPNQAANASNPDRRWMRFLGTGRSD